MSVLAQGRAQSAEGHWGAGYLRLRDDHGPHFVYHILPAGLKQYSGINHTHILPCGETPVTARSILLHTPESEWNSPLETGCWDSG